MSDLALSRRWQLILLATLALAWFGSLDHRRLIKPDEGRYAEIAREMAASGDWVTPRLNGIKYFEKPPLQYWVTAAAFKVFGEHDWSARVWPAATGFLGILLAWFTGRRLFGDTAGWLGAAALASSFFYLVIGHFNTLDMGLCFFLQLASSGFLLAQRAAASGASCRNWMLLAWAGAALAVLSKGLVSLVLPGATLVLYSLVTRDFFAWRKLHPLSGLAVFLAIAAPWHVLASLQNPEFARFYFIHEHFERFLTKVHGRVEPWWYFVPVLFAAALPWSTLAIHAALAQWKARGEAGRALRFLAVWCAFTLVFFSASGSKLPSYILPILPAFALIAGAFATRVSSPAMAFHAGVTAILAAVALALVHRVTDRADADTPVALLQAYETVLLAAAGVWLFGGLLAVGLAYRRRIRGAALSLAIGTFAMGMLAMLGHEHLSPSNSAWHIAQQVKPMLAPNAPIYSVRYFEHTLPYYLRRTLILVDYRDEMDFGLTQEPHLGLPTVAQFELRWRSDDDAFAVMTEEMRLELESRGLPMQIVARDTRRVIIRKPRPDKQ
ncbi:MAG: glycosyltransferase family 39 protein [Sterolibacteriaceae bacterium]|nr:glycosyltransferase family 39 protein [Candidatus Methylophosphatis haderslevensis]